MPHDPPQRRTLIVEDDVDIAELVRLHLSDICQEVVVTHDGRDGLCQALAGDFGLIVLDLRLPGIDGLEICRRLRVERGYTPILMLTAKSTEMDRVLGLELGADDYLVKPFSVLELIARAKAIFRRVEALKHRDSDQGKCLTHGPLRIDVEQRQVTVHGRAVALTAKEFDLLLHFVEHPGRVYRRSQLLDLVWGYGHAGYEHTVNSHINRLRAKIENDPTHPVLITTVWGVGYRFNPEASGA